MLIRLTIALTIALAVAPRARAQEPLEGDPDATVVPVAPVDDSATLADGSATLADGSVAPPGLGSGHIMSTL